MLAGSEFNVRRLGACDVKAKWVVENRFVTIARVIAENHFVTRPNCLPRVAVGHSEYSTCATNPGLSHSTDSEGDR